MSETTAALQSLLDRMNAGDPRAKNDLITRANGRLEVVARRLLRQFPKVKAEEETAGVVNEAYPRLDKALADLKPGNVRQFLGLASLKMRQTLLDMVRRLTGRGEDERPDMVPLPGARGGDGQDRGGDLPAGGDDLGVKARSLDVLEAIDQLPEMQREVVELLYFQGFTQAEAGEVLGVSEDTVKRRWAEARVALFTRLGAYQQPKAAK
jgi:RNA polymerase sigma-70 factor (ECF subfamily)